MFDRQAGGGGPVQVLAHHFWKDDSALRGEKVV
jgi:hypothetical protein